MRIKGRWPFVPEFGADWCFDADSSAWPFRILTWHRTETRSLTIAD